MTENEQQTDFFDPGVKNNKLEEYKHIRYSQIFDKYQYLSFTLKGNTDTIIYISTHNCSFEDIIALGSNGNSIELLKADAGLANQTIITDNLTFTSNNTPKYLLPKKPCGLKREQILIARHTGDTTISLKMNFN